MSTQLDYEQAIQLVTDDTNDAFRVNIVAGGGGGGSPTPILSGDGSGNQATVTAGKALLVDGSATTQPVSASTLPLPTGASTSANQTNGTQKSQIVDGSGNVIGSTTNALDVNIKSGITLEVHLDNTNDNVLVYGFDGSINQPIKTDATGELQIDVLSSALPSGAATSTLQTTGNSSLSSIDGKIPANLTVSSTRLLVDGSGVTQPVSAASLPLPTGASSSANQTNGTQLTRITDGTDTASVTATGELNVLSTAQPGVDVGDVTINNAAGASAVNIQDGGNSITVDGTVAVSSVGGTVTVAATDLDIRDLTSASDSVAAVQSGTWNINNISGTVSLPTGASTSANQTNKTQYTRITDGTDDALVTATGELNVLATAQPGVDVGDVTINNAAGASAVNIQDGGNSITVDGTVTVTATNLDIRDLTSVSDSVSAVQSGTWTINSTDSGYANSEFVRNDYSSVNVTTAAYVTLIASTAQAYKQFEIFDSSGQTLVIAFGAAASEVNQFLVFPGGNGAIRKSVPSGTRVSIKAVSANATVGEIALNLYG